MEAHPNDVLLAKPAKIAETEKQLDWTNSHPAMPGRPISSASQRHTAWPRGSCSEPDSQPKTAQLRR